MYKDSEICVIKVASATKVDLWQVAQVLGGVGVGTIQGEVTFINEGAHTCGALDLDAL